VTAMIPASALNVSLLTHRNVCQTTDMSQGEPGVVLDTSLGYMLKAAASALHSALEAVLRPLGMTITHYACLELLAQRPGLSNSELARGTFVTRQSMNVLLQALERQGLVVRPAQAPVGRALPTELTARGRRQLTIASAAVRRVEQDMLANLDAGEQDQVRRLLPACIASLAGPPAPATQLLRNLRLCRVPGCASEPKYSAEPAVDVLHKRFWQVARRFLKVSLV